VRAGRRPPSTGLRPDPFSAKRSADGTGTARGAVDLPAPSAAPKRCPSAPLLLFVTGANGEDPPQAAPPAVRLAARSPQQPGCILPLNTLRVTPSGESAR